jgi:type III pantothenate kinase
VTPDVVVDIGNSRMKWGRVRDSRVEETAALGHDDPVDWKRQLGQWAAVAADLRWAVASVVPTATARFCEWLAAKGATATELTTAKLNRCRKLRFWTEVDAPAELGADRFLASLAAHRSAPKPAAVVAISVGTAMTVDFVEPDGTHVGGAILPGPRLMARSLFKRTAKLPRVELTRAVPDQVWGTNTKDAIGLGVASAVLGAADQLVWDWAARCTAPVWVYVTGGDAGYFRDFVFTADVDGLTLAPNLILEGVRLAAEALP